MITFWRTTGNILSQIDSFEEHCYIRVFEPTKDELEHIQFLFGIPEDFLSDVLDVDERSRLEIEEDKLFIIVRTPVHHPGNGIPYSTVPLGFVITPNTIVSICLHQTEILDNLVNNRIKNLQTGNKTDFLLSLFLHNSTIYHKYLKAINIETNLIENDLERSTKNKELHKLLRMEKCLVYFTTSLRSNELLLARLRSSRYVRPDTYSEELLEDVIIENRQAIDMANIYSDIQSGMMDAFASIISNNLNIVMKQLTTVTVILMIPTLVASFFGMNVVNSMENSPFSFLLIVIISVMLAIAGGLFIRYRRWF